MAAGTLPVLNATAGVLDSSATMPATVDVDLPTHNAGDCLVLLVLCRNANNDGTLASINTEGWTQLGGAGNTYGGTQNARIGIGWKIGNGSEGVVNITTTGGTTTDRRLSRVYRFTAADGFAAPAVANITSAITGTSNAITMPTVDPGGNLNRLAVCCCGVASSATISTATGESNGDWTEVVGESATTNGTIGVQRSDQSSGNAISGGTAGLSGSYNWVSIGFTLNPAELIPTITSIDGNNDTVDTRTGAVIVGTFFGASETGSAKVEVSNNATYGAGTVVEIDATAWSATSITVSLRRESDNAALATLFTLPLNPAYLWITDSLGVRNTTGFQFILRPPGPTPFADLNANATLEVNTTYILRARVLNTGGVGGADFKWRYNHAAGGLADITTTSAKVKAVNASSFANNDDVPQVIGGSGNYITNNDAATEDGTTTLPANFAAGGAAEFVLAFQIVSADVSDADTGIIHLTLSDGTELGSYSNQLTYTVHKVAGDVTANTVTGKIVFAGQTATLQVGSALSTTTGAVVFKGQTATFTSHFTASTTTGKITFAGQTATVQVGWTSAPSTGAVLFRGETATVQAGWTSAPNTGAVTFSGQPPSVSLGFTASPATGQILFTGSAPTIVAEQSFTADTLTGQIRFVGQAPTVVAETSFTADTQTGSLFFTGQSATVQTGVVAQPNTGSLLITGQAATLVAGATTEPNPGSINFTGQAPSLSIGQGPEAVTGRIVFIGYPPDVQAEIGFIGSTNTGTVRFIGEAPTTSASFAVETVTGSITFAGLAASFVSHFTGDTQTGLISFVGQAATLAASFATEPIESSIVFTGFAPEVTTTVDVTPQTGQILFTGLIPDIQAEGQYSGTPDTGRIEFIGEAPTVSADALVETSTGQILFTGFAPDAEAIPGTGEIGAVEWLVRYIVTEVPFTADTQTGQIIISGFAPTVSTTGDVTADTQTGTIRFIGQTANVTAGASVDTNTGQVLFAGFAPDVAVEGTVNVTPVTGSVQFIGQASSVTADSAVTTNVGQITFTGFAPTVNADATIDTVTGQIQFSGQPTDLQAGATSAPTTGQIVVTGYAPTVTAQASVVPNTGQVLFTGYPPDVTIEGTVSVTPATGSIQFVGQAPTVSTDVAVQPTTGIIVFSGQAPTIVAGTGFAANTQTGTIKFTGFAPSASLGFGADTSNGQIRFVGQGINLETNNFNDTQTGRVVIRGYAPSVIAGTGAIVTTNTGTIVIAGEKPDWHGHFIAANDAGTVRFIGFAPTLFVEGNITVEPLIGHLTFQGQKAFVTWLPAPARRTVYVDPGERIASISGNRLVPVGSQDRQRAVTGRRRIWVRPRN